MRVRVSGFTTAIVYAPEQNYTHLSRPKCVCMCVWWSFSGLVFVPMDAVVFRGLVCSMHARPIVVAVVAVTKHWRACA